MTLARSAPPPTTNAVFAQALLHAVSPLNGLGFVAIGAAGVGLSQIVSGPVAVILATLCTAVYAAALIARKSAQSQQVDQSRFSIGEILERQVEKGKRVSIQEPISGLLQRWYFELRLAEEIRRCRRYGMLMAVLRVYAPAPGRSAKTSGPERELHLAQEIAHHLRAVDIAARIGELEYIVCLPHTDVVGAQVAAKRLMDSLQEWSLIVAISTYPLDGSDVDSILQAALTGEPVDVSALDDVVDLPRKRSFKRMVASLGPEETAEAQVRVTETPRQVRQKLNRAARNAGVALTIWEENGRLLYRLSAGSERGVEAA